jgi:peptide/nickel transport system permease protein
VFSDLIRNKKFLCGFLFLSLLLAASIANSVFNDGNIRQVQVIYENGYPVAKAPFPPSWKFPFGTDQNGYDMLHIIIQGAKYTIGISFLIALLRVGIGVAAGIVMGTFLKKWSSRIEPLFDSFTVVPMTIIAYFLLVNVLKMPFGGFPHPFYQRVLFEMFVLTVLAVPTVSFYIANEVKKLFATEFVMASRVLGGFTLHIIRKHIFLHLRPILVVLLIQQFNQVMLVLAHLGVLKLFFGGTIIDYSPMGAPPRTFSFEWSGLIGDNFEMIYLYPWIAFVPILFFSLAIIAANLMLAGVQNATETAQKRTKEINVEGDYVLQN